MGTICLSINLKNGGISQYNNFAFSSFCNRFGQILGTMGGVGVCAIGEQYSTDNGAAIMSSFETFSGNFDYPGPKTIRSMVVQYQSISNLTFAYKADEERERSKTLSPFNRTPPGGPQAQQVNGDSDLLGTVFSFSVANRNGDAFTVYSVHATPIFLNIGRSRVR